jgi:hypothetical protein
MLILGLISSVAFAGATNYVTGSQATELMNSLVKQLATPAGPQVSVQNIDCKETDMGPGGKNATCTIKVGGPTAISLAESLKASGAMQTIANPETVEMNVHDLSCLAFIVPGPNQGQTKCSFSIGQ